MSETSDELLARFRPEMIGKVELVQEGRITLASAKGRTFVDRADGFMFSLLDHKRGDLLLDSETRWAHFRPA